MGREDWGLRLLTAAYWRFKRAIAGEAGAAPPPAPAAPDPEVLEAAGAGAEGEALVGEVVWDILRTRLVKCEPAERKNPERFSREDAPPGGDARLVVLALKELE